MTYLNLTVEACILHKKLIFTNLRRSLQENLVYQCFYSLLYNIRTETINPRKIGRKIIDHSR